eukprot:151385-Pelagomonas_calceolata.AAC.2
MLVYAHEGRIQRPYHKTSPLVSCTVNFVPRAASLSTAACATDCLQICDHPRLIPHKPTHQDPPAIARLIHASTCHCGSHPHKPTHPGPPAIARQPTGCWTAHGGACVKALVRCGRQSRTASTHQARNLAGPGHAPQNPAGRCS